MSNVEKSWDEEAERIGACAMSSIRDMVAALQCDYDRLGELRDERDGYDTCDVCGQEIQELGEKDKPFSSCACGMAKTTRAACWAKDRPDDAEELKELEEAAGDCESEDDARQRIDEDPLSLQFRSGWVSPGDDMVPEEFELLLSTGGPAVRIIGEIENGCASSVRLQVQDWFKPWTDYYVTGEDREVIDAYCACFCFEC